MMINIGDTVRFNKIDGNCMGEVISINNGKITIKLNTPIKKIEASQEMFDKI